MSETAEKGYSRVFNAWTAGEQAYALELCRELVRTFPDYNIAWLLEGVLLYETARYVEAEQVLREAIQGMSLEQLPYGYTHLGHLYKDQGRYDEAEKWYRKAVELEPEDADRHILVGVLLAAKSDLDGAEGCYRKATRCREGRIEEAYFNLGLVVSARECYEEALECFTKALEIRPDYKEAKAGKSDMEKTIDFLMHGRELPEGEVRPRASEAADAGEHAYALELYRELRRNDPDVAIWRVMEGVQLYEIGRYEEAGQLLREVIHQRPLSLLNPIYTRLGHLCKEQGHYDEAEIWYRKAVELRPEDAGWNVFLGALLARKGNLKAAEECHRKATLCAKGPVDEAYLNLGLVLRAQERYEEALDCFSKALQITADYPEAIKGKTDMEKVIAYLGPINQETKAMGA